MSAKYRLPVPVFHFWPKLTQRGLSAIAELYLFVMRTCSRYFFICEKLRLHWLQLSSVRLWLCMYRWRAMPIACVYCIY